MNIDRRTLLIGGGAGVGLVVAFALWPERLDSDLAAAPDEQLFGNFIKIARDGRVTVATPQAETGQGIWTALPQVVADELGANWDMVGVEPAPLTGSYANRLAEDEGWLDGFGMLRSWRVGGELRITAGSTSVRAFEQPLREAAAVARTMLVGAAADRWNVSPSECEVAEGLVLMSGQSFTFGELAEEAASRSPPSRPELRQDQEARLIGRALPRLDGPAKATGATQFAGDVRLPNMLFASARLAPPGGRLTGYSREAAAKSPGVRHLAAHEASFAVAAETWWAAERAVRAADPRFTGPQTSDARATFEDSLATGASEEWFSRGDYDAATRGARALAATYYAAPALHLGLEPLCATARFSGDRLEVWVPTQAPEAAKARAEKSAGGTRVTLYPMPVGEPAGRALEADAVPLAIALARASGRPVQLSLSQSASQNHDHPSGGALARLMALPDPAGLISAWKMRAAVPSGFGAALAALFGAGPPSGPRKVDLDGAVPPYTIPNLAVDALPITVPFEGGYMRGSPQREFCFFTESFVDELARRAGLEPLAFRMSMLGGSGRLARCLQGAARLGQWDGGGAGSTMGIAGCSAFGSHIGLVATASIAEDQRIKVHKLVAAVDCGRAVNAGLVTQQIEAGLLWALGQATVAAPDWVSGMPRSRPVGGIGLPRLADSPQIVVQVIASSEPPGGVSGLGTTVLAPAVANAIFAGSGKRLRSLPFDLMAAA